MSYTITRVVAVDSDDGWEAFAEAWPVEDMPSVRIVIKRTPTHRDPMVATFDLSPKDARAFARSILHAANKRKP